MPVLKYDIFETSFGWMGVVASGLGIRRLTLPERSRADAETELGGSIQGAVRDRSRFGELRGRLDRYFSGEPEDLTREKIDLGDPEFFTSVRAACRTIPAGETRSYSWLARVAGRPNATRAAGQAMARNPVPLLVPCHRVVGSDGRLHGFGGGVGLPLKARLLELEGCQMTSARALNRIKSRRQLTLPEG